MGFFSNISDIVSGKNSQINNLIHKNSIIITDQVDGRNDFIQIWIIDCVAGIDLFLQLVIFDSKDDGLKLMRSLSRNLTEQSSFEIFKLLVGHYLSVFLQNEDNLNYLRQIKIERNDFKSEIFKMLKYSTDDKKIFEDMEKIQRTNVAGYSLRLFKLVISRGFNTEPSHADILIPSLTFTAILAEYYKRFINLLSQDE